MIVFILAIALVCLVTLRRADGEAQPLSHENTTIINGVFVLLIFLSHSTQYCTLSEDLLGSLYQHVQNIQNQWVVVTFLAFSGYGVMRRIASGGAQYLAQFPVRRIFKTWVNFAAAILLYLAMNCALGISYALYEVALSFIGLTSVGNSNWYMFVILLLYLLSYLGARLLSGRGGADCSGENSGRKLAGFVTAATLCYFIAAQFLLPSRFSSTVFCYPLGMYLALYEEKLTGLCRKRPLPCLAVLGVLLLATYKLRWNDAVMNFASVCFVLAVVWFLCFFRLESRLLKFVGKHTFSIFILQRLPFQLFASLAPAVCENCFLFVPLSFAITVGLALCYDRLLEQLDRRMVNGLLTLTGKE